MEYSTHALSRLSGVSTRTLRWYDKINLLKPGRVAENGYRYYGRAEVDRLQDILFYRALGVELARIKEYLDDPSFDRLSVLRSHLTALEGERDRIDSIIRSVQETIQAEERNETMLDKKKFAAFKRNAVEEKEASFGREARERYGNEAVDATNSAMMGMTQEQYQEWDHLGQEIQKRLEKAVQSGLTADSEEGKVISGLHKRWLILSGTKYNAGTHKGIAELYVMDERFTAYYDKNLPGCARFLRDAVHHWVQ